MKKEDLKAKKKEDLKIKKLHRTLKKLLKRSYANRPEGYVW